MIDQALAHFSPRLPLAVAYSGGADSTALLLACQMRWAGHVFAVHVHHGLQAAADDFVAHCQAQCAQFEIPLLVCYVNARHKAGQSPEDAARQARYRSLIDTIKNDSAWAKHSIQSIALAQHADDQLETLLLALSRGAGLPGLSAMPKSWMREGVQFERPFLDVPNQAIRDWLSQLSVEEIKKQIEFNRFNRFNNQHNLYNNDYSNNQLNNPSNNQNHQKINWIEDPTNHDLRFTRNQIRAQLLPVLDAVFPSFRQTAARSSQHAAQAQSLLHELAVDDLAQIQAPPLIKLLQNLSQNRQSNVLRHWLKVHHNCTPNTTQLAELLKQIKACQTRGHKIHIKIGHGFIQRVNDYLIWLHSN